jgi:hypothetical protein
MILQAVHFAAVSIDMLVLVDRRIRSVVRPPHAAIPTANTWVTRSGPDSRIVPDARATDVSITDLNVNGRCSGLEFMVTSNELVAPCFTT